LPEKSHQYRVIITWTGNKGVGTRSYRDFGRDHEICAEGKSVIPGSSDPNFRGDRTRWNPEELLVASVSACHELWYLHLCSTAGVIVTSYADHAHGTMEQTAVGGGHFTEVVLRPRVTVLDASMTEAALRLHAEASARCFIAASVNFPVRHEPTTRAAD